MKSSKAIKVLYGLAFVFALSACSLNASNGGDLVASQMRGSRSGAVTPINGQLAIDLKNTGRPPYTSSKWKFLNNNRQGVDAFLSLAEGRNVIIPNELYPTVEVFFWGDFKSRVSTRLELGNEFSEQQFFSNLDPNDFQFEITIFDYFTETIDPVTNKKFDYLGYAYFGRNGSNRQVGLLNRVIYDDSTGIPVVTIFLSDSIGEVIIVFEINRATQSMENGEIYFRPLGQVNSTSFLGFFNSHKLSEMFEF